MVDGTRPYWLFRPDAACPLSEIDLSSSDDQAVLEAAGKLLSIPCDPATSDPVRFHLLHRPHGKDVFVMQYTHALMDNSATMRLVREIDAADRASDGRTAVRQSPSSDLLRNHLRQFGPARRRLAAQQAIEVHGHVLRGRATTLSPAAQNVTVTAGLRIAVRELPPHLVAAVHERVLKTCGFPNLSMALLSSTFRGIGQLAPRQPGRRFVAGIGLDLNLRRENGSLFGNLMSLAPLGVEEEELADRDTLTRGLCRQMRQRLATDFDLGALRLTNIFARRRRHIEWVVAHILRYNYSLWYAFFGSLDAVGETFAGANVEKAFYTGPAWSPLGVTLLANLHRGRLLLQATYIPEIAPPALIDQYLDLIVADLLG
jgi:hypothetical protein